MTRLDRVTITGADDSIDPKDLAKLSIKYPFVEWGILVSSSCLGNYYERFPSHLWIEKLQALATQYSMQLSLHLCGRWVRDILIGEDSVPAFLFDGFKRVQLNFHAERAKANPVALLTLLKKKPHQFIFQIDGAFGNKYLTSLYEMANPPDVVPLFDISGGAGVLPTKWPMPSYRLTMNDFVYHGYAGGLGPDNLSVQLPNIMEASAPARIWIDMETRVRSKYNFDLTKVEQVLQIAEPFLY